jgi:hypothetical protein
VFLTVNPAHRKTIRSAELITKSGRKYDIPALRLDRLLEDSPEELLQASFHD